MISVQRWAALWMVEILLRAEVGISVFAYTPWPKICLHTAVLVKKDINNEHSTWRLSLGKTRLRWGKSLDCLVYRNCSGYLYYVGKFQLTSPPQGRNLCDDVTAHPVRCQEGHLRQGRWLPTALTSLTSFWDVKVRILANAPSWNWV
jgi:hypothetical protein